jgi:predicted RNA binding protein YcfA (HicA-like mRNA interferase family)
MRRVGWEDLAKVCLRLGCVLSRQKGSHMVFTRADLARPVVIPKHKELAPDVVRSNLRTLGISRLEFEDLLSRL